MAAVKPFRAVRYDERRAGPLASLVAPPYDVIGPEERERHLAASPYNVVHLTLPDDESEAARLWAEWLDEGVLVRDEEPALWWLAQDYVGPDGVARTREGLACSLRAEPYSAGVILPHERTHAGPKEGRLRLLRATRVHFEPIFLLFDGRLERDGPDDPLMDVEEGGVRNRLWRFEGDLGDALADARLLIADGHHRYETALAFHEEDGSEESAWLLAVIVGTAQEGVTIFPTHRIARSLGNLDGAEPVDGAPAPLEALREGAVLYRGGRSYRLPDGEIDAAAVEPFAPEGVTYTPSAEAAIAAVDGGQAEAAFLLRPPTVEQVQAVAERGQTMPQKSTYFYPKLPSGLLFLEL